MPTNLQKSSDKKKYLSSILLTVGERDFIYEGASVINKGSNLIGFTIRFKPRNERTKDAYQYLSEIKKELHNSLNDTAGYTTSYTIETGSSNKQQPVQIDLNGDNFIQLTQYANSIKKELKEIPEFYNINDSTGQQYTQAHIIPRQKVLKQYSITEDDFNQQLSFYFNANKIAEIHLRDLNKNHEIHMQTCWKKTENKRHNPANWQEWQSIYIMSPQRKWLPLSLLAQVKFSTEASAITHKNGQRSITIYADSTIHSFKKITDKLTPLLNKLQRKWKQGYNYEFAGEIKQAKTTFSNSEQALFFAILGVFTILVIQFNSFLQPFIILCTVIFGLCGVALGFTLCAIEFSFPAFIGIITLAGINVNDGIILVDTINKIKNKKNLTLAAAVAQGTSQRLRPILSTTLTTLFGLIPLAIYDTSWRPLCSAIIFGEILSTITAIIFIPAIYCLLSHNKQKDIT